MKIVDVIERELTLPVSRQRAWDSITRPKELSQWFGDVVELDFDVGGKFIMRWENGDTTTGVVETIEEPHKFAYRWYASEMGNHLPLSPENSTLVTFLLEEVKEGTHLIVRETGFAALEESIREAARGENESGWTIELRELVDHLTSK